MAMIKCTECGKEISDKATSCPNCGCPVSYSARESTNDNQYEEYSSNTSSVNNGFFLEINGNREDMTKLWMECDGKVDCIAKLRKKYNLSLKDSKEYVDDFMRKTNIEDKKQVKNKEHNKLIVESVILLILGIACIATSQAFGAILFMVLAYACYPKNKNSNNPNKVNNYELQTEKDYKNTLKLTCPNCESDNVTVNVENVANGYSGKSELRKKSVVTNTANSAGRLGMTMMTGGLWLLTPKKSKYKEIQKGKTNYVKITTCICQNCGYSWNK